jgi:hypothetical protein
MKAINLLFVAIVATLADSLRAIYARHQLHYHKTSALDLRENIKAEQYAIEYHDAEARRIEFQLLDSQLLACREREAKIESRLRELTLKQGLGTGNLGAIHHAEIRH